MLDSGLKTHRGVLHVHADAGVAGVDSILRTAKALELDFVVLADPLPPEGPIRTGWCEDVLLLVGQEVRCADGHYLAFGNDAPLDGGELARLPILESVEHARALGARIVSNHWHFESSAPGVVPPPLPLENADLVEAWCFADEVLAGARGPQAPMACLRPDRFLFGPPQTVLQAWDHQQRTRRLPAVGGLNAHQRKEPILDWRLLFPLEASLGSICTAILSDSLPRDDAATASRLVWEALAAGRSYVYNASLGRTPGFDFWFEDSSGSQWGFGDTVEFRVGGGRLHVRVPRKAEVVLRQNSQPLFWGTARELAFPVLSPGVFRTEVRVGGRLWILGNAIRMLGRPEDSTRHPRVRDFT